MHPLVRDLYKRVILVGRDYPLGLPYVRTTWKKALRNPDNCPSCYTNDGEQHKQQDNHHSKSNDDDNNDDDVSLKRYSQCERETRKAVGKGRFYVREMIGVIQLKKYRTMKKRYNSNDNDNEALQKRMQEIVQDAIGGGGTK
mmetsp:Transcript_29672/g.48964  ORF Transcript_29672/g.48964 Transcript_29672/m.48964 type:complete len:142 (-) Transcript_29672:427-852(-)